MRILHTMLRVGDLQRSLDFYTQVLGMKLLRKSDYPGGRFTNAFVGYDDESRTAVLNRRICASTPLTAGITSFPSTRIGRFDRFRSATWRTALRSVVLIFSPGNIFSTHPGRSACRASPRVSSSRRTGRAFT